MTIYTSVVIDGAEFPNNSSIEINNNISEVNSSSSFTLQTNNTEGLNKSIFTAGDSILIYANKDVVPATTKIFSGFIDDVNYSGEGTSETITVTGRDLTSRLQDSTVEPCVYTNQEISLIVIDLVSNYSHNITTNNVAITGVTLTRRIFKHISVFDALKQLADICGFMFWVDVDGDLHFVRKGSSSSGLVFDNTNVTKSEIVETTSDIVNEVWVYGSRQLSAYEESFTANGGSEFQLGYAPHNTSVFIAGGSVSRKGGIANLYTEVPSGVQFLVEYNSKKIIMTSGTVCGDNIPTSGDNVDIKYDRSVPIVKYGLDRSSIGIYEYHPKVIVDKTITDPRMASDMVKSELLNSYPKKQGTVSVKGILQVVSGQTVTVNLPKENLNNLVFDVISTKFTFNPTTLYTEDIMTVTVNKKIKDILDTIKQLALDIKKIRADEAQESDTVTRLEVSTGSFGIRSKGYRVGFRSAGNSFILGHPVNGRLGNSINGVNGSQVTLGDYRGDLTIKYINNDEDTFRESFGGNIYKGDLNTADWNNSLRRLVMSTSEDQTDIYTTFGRTGKIFQDDTRNLTWVKVNSTETKFGNDSIRYFVSKDNQSWNLVNKNAKTDIAIGSVLYSQIEFVGNGANQTYIEDLEVSYG